MALRLLIGVLAMLAGVLACSKPEPVRVTPRSVSITGVNPQGIDLAVQLDVYNPNSFPIWAQEVTGAVLVNGTEVARGAARPTASIPAKGSAVVPATLSPRWTQIGALAPFALSGAAVPFEVRGVARLGGESLNVDVPFTLTGSLTRDQVMQAGMRGFQGATP